MSEIVTGTPAVVGFTNGNYDRHNYQYQYQLGLTDKDQMFAMSIDGGEQTRDLLGAVSLTNLTVEKTGAANSLAIEKIGAAGILESAKNSAALHVQIAAAASASALIAAQNQQAAMMYANTNASAGILFAAQNQATLAAQIAECCCESKALMLSIESNRVRDELSLLQTQFLIVTGGLTPSVARARLTA